MHNVEHPDAPLKLPHRDRFIEQAQVGSLYATMFDAKGSKRFSANYIVPAINAFLKPLTGETIKKLGSTD